MDNVEFEILKKYLKGSIVAEGDRNLLKKYSSIGRVHFGYTTSRGKPEETAKLTPRGEREIKDEITYRHPIKRRFYEVVASIFG